MFKVENEPRPISRVSCVLKVKAIYTVDHPFCRSIDLPLDHEYSMDVHVDLHLYQEASHSQLSIRMKTKIAP